jgi:hypothetical protein
MRDAIGICDRSLAGLGQADWLDALAQVELAPDGLTALGDRHHALTRVAGDTLLVTFETIQGIQALDEHAHPFGWRMLRRAGWSHMALISDGDTWFRDPAVHAFFDRMADDAVFDGYGRVVFYGAGPCGYAAAAYSAAAPGAAVVAVQPQATLDPEMAGWDDRFTEARRQDFTTRYGYAPDMVEAAARAYVIFDPAVALDAMHAALFRAPHVQMLPARWMGETVQTRLRAMDLLPELLQQAADGTLTRAGFARLTRARRDHQPYLRDLLARLDAAERPRLAIKLCSHVAGRMDAPRFARRLAALEAAE